MLNKKLFSKKNPTFLTNVSYRVKELAAFRTRIIVFFLKNINRQEHFRQSPTAIQEAKTRHQFGRTIQKRTQFLFS
jgi:hypothetical protein